MGEIDLSDRKCPCTYGYHCDALQQICVPGASSPEDDASSVDGVGGPPADGSMDNASERTTEGSADHSAKPDVATKADGPSHDTSSTTNFTLLVSITHCTLSSTPAGIDCGVVDGGSGPSCIATFPPGTPVTLTAIHGGAYHLDGWTGPCGGVNVDVCTFTMTGNLSVSVSYSLD